MVSRSLVVFFFLCGNATAQLTRDSFKSFQDARNNALAADAAWSKAKKIGLVKPPKEPHAHSECLDPAELTESSMGYLDAWIYSILDIVGPKDLLVAINNPRIPTLWVSDYPTTGLADGDKVVLIGLVEVSGTKSYETVGGSMSTVRVLTFVPREREEKIKADIAARKEAALVRTWIDSTGKYKTVGKFIDFKNGHANIERTQDGKSISVPISRLSDADQKWIREELKRRREESAKKKEVRSSPAN